MNNYIEKPIFRPIDTNISNRELSDKLIVILFDKLIDLSEFRYNIYTHRLITTAILLSKEYLFDDVAPYIINDDKLKGIHDYLNDLYKISRKISKSSPDHEQCLIYCQWHEYSRYLTDNLSEEMQPKQILDRLLVLYDNFKLYENDTDHNVFLENSTLFLEDYN